MNLSSIAVRTDSNEIIGSGHMNRCIAIAVSLRRIGVAPVFFVADEVSGAAAVNSGFRCEIIGTDFRDTEGELPFLLEAIEDHGTELLLVDSYFVTERYFCGLSQSVGIAYMDDLAEILFPFDFLINYGVNPVPEAYRYYSDKQTRLLLGTDYTPLRNDFVGDDIPQINDKVETVLILTGGSDRVGAAKKIADEIVCRNSSGSDGILYRFVCGKYSPDRGLLEESAKCSANIEVYFDVKDMANLMRQSDVAIASSGTTLFELAACGVPSVCYTVANNQISNAENFSERCGVNYAGDFRYDEDLACVLLDAVDLLSCDTMLRKGISQKMNEVVDGKGAERISIALAEYDKKRHSK